MAAAVNTPELQCIGVLFHYVNLQCCVQKPNCRVEAHYYAACCLIRMIYLWRLPGQLIDLSKLYFSLNTCLLGGGQMQ